MFRGESTLHRPVGGYISSHDAAKSALREHGRIDVRLNYNLSLKENLENAKETSGGVGVILRVAKKLTEEWARVPLNWKKELGLDDPRLNGFNNFLGSHPDQRASISLIEKALRELILN